MLKTTFLITFLLLCPALAKAQTQVIDQFDNLEHRFKATSDSLLVINFWATWCAPCVKELPYVLATEDYRPETPKKVILVSLDFPDQIESKLLPFLREHEIEVENYVLTDPDMNTWIPKVHPDWDGAIPATVLIDGDRSALLRTTFKSKDELFAAIDRFVEQTNSHQND